MAKVAEAKVDFDIIYPLNCPECAKEGKEVKVGFSTATGLGCESGAHSYASMAEAEGNVPQAPTDAPTASQEPAATVKIGGFDSNVYSGGQPTRDGLSNEKRQQERQQRAHEDLQERMREAARRGARGPQAAVATAAESARRDVAALLAQQVLENERRAAETPGSNGKPVQVLDTKPLPAGELQVTIVLRERHLSAVAAEAGVQKRTVGQELERFVEAALDNYWGQV